jgi:hypothetical protein
MLDWSESQDWLSSQRDTVLLMAAEAPLQSFWSNVPSSSQVCEPYASARFNAPHGSQPSRDVSCYS